MLIGFILCELLLLLLLISCHFYCRVHNIIIMYYNIISYVAPRNKNPSRPGLQRLTDRAIKMFYYKNYFVRRVKRLVRDKGQSRASVHNNGQLTTRNSRRPNTVTIYYREYCDYCRRQFFRIFSPYFFFFFIAFYSRLFVIIP